MSSNSPLPVGAARAGRAAVVLAAGKSTRMRSQLPKPLHPVCGRPLTRHVIDSCRAGGADLIVVVVGHQAEQVSAGLGPDVTYALQAEQLGSGDAARSAASVLADFSGTVIVVAGDVPLLRPETVARLIERHESTGAAATLLTAMMDDATGYGRIVRNPDGSVARIVEHRDATPEERALREWNPSIYCFECQALFRALGEIRADNVQAELYLTDAIGILSGWGKRVEALITADIEEVLGVNTRVELAQVAGSMRNRILEQHMLAGVTITDPQTTYVDVGVRIGQDTVLEPQTFLTGRTSVGEGCTIGPQTRVFESVIGSGTRIVASQVAESVIGDHVKIGPYANVRPGCELADGVKIGDFVELKNAHLGERVSASHLSYIGDSVVGSGTNIGAGVITCNFDGARKHRTTIGNDAFIGTNSTLIAPVTIGDGAFVAAATPVDQDVPADSLAIGRTRLTIKPGWARERRPAAAKS